ncbi:MAG TPA: YHS domain-containing (seleno)protein [Chryseolinea sp.]|nr:YHS domain-containing (seleno)protein [Chryseolinea sp.]HPH46798.1 YHS domain-containing (seleno)protein [Chryseolinea sp.]HPM30444.1 YHS domain-containing (seleno)protein [Chryseolinea sp.]
MNKIVILFFLALASLSGIAQKAEVFSTSNGAIGGYDPVAYFTVGKPVMGDPKISFHWHDADWYFSSEQNRDAFKISPEKYTPQFGGYCAYGVSDNHKAPTDPDAWTIVDDKLYLNYNLNVKKLWSKDRAGLIKKANDLWPTVKVME